MPILARALFHAPEQPWSCVTERDFGATRCTGSSTVKASRSHASTKSMATTYTYDDTRILKAPNAFDPTETAGNRLLRRPANSGSLTLNAAFRRVNFALAGYFTSARTDSDFLGLGFTRNPGYARFDIATHYDIGRGVSLYARAANLFDKQYQDALGYPALGRDFRLGLKYRFAGRN